MSSRLFQSGYLRIFIVILTTAFVFSFAFFCFNSESISSFSVSFISPNSQPNCSASLSATSLSATNLSATNLSASNLQIDSETVKTEPDLIILMWMWPFGWKFDLTCEPYGITGCMLTVDKAFYPKANAVMFHHRDIRSDLQNMPKDPRPSFQKWVWYNMESPENSGKFEGLNNLFNLTCNYRLDSDIPTPYGSLVPVSADDELFTRVPTKDKLACWIVSNWNTNYKRVSYFNELKKHVEIKTYGRAFGQYINDQEYVKIMSSCKFYMSFENSIFKDYMTEKLYRPLELGAVPVVLGPPRENYEKHIPGNSFIHIDDYPSPKELGERLKYLDEHPDEYMNYFEWRNSFKSVPGNLGQEHACRTCHYLKKQNRYQVFHDLNKWYWG